MQLSQLTSQGPVALVAQRQFPGYQCPVCNAQAGQFPVSAAKLAERGARVVLVYPGPSDGLMQRAGEFVRGKDLPEHFELVLDPDYALTNAYGLRRDAPRETAYPSTFVVAKGGRSRLPGSA